MTSITPNTAEPSSPHFVGGFYDRWTDLFLAGAGPILQAGILRTGNPPLEEPERSVIELAGRAGIRDRDRVLDAGCGVGGPAVAIARRYPRVTIEGVTVSPGQATIAQNFIQQSDLNDRVRVIVADYQKLPLPNEHFDVVVFFESTGYASDLDATYAETFRVLTPGGRLYVKDVFCSPEPISDSDRAAMEAFDDLWGCVRSKTIAETIEATQRAGFEIERSGVIPDIGTARLMGAMFQFDPSAGLSRSELGDSFWRCGLNPPIEFGEIIGVKPLR